MLNPFGTSPGENVYKHPNLWMTNTSPLIPIPKIKKYEFAFGENLRQKKLYENVFGGKQKNWKQHF